MVSVEGVDLVDWLRLDFNFLVDSLNKESDNFRFISESLRMAKMATRKNM
jgi:hypothetical protein